MKAVRNDNSGTWHLLGRRGCGAGPNGKTVEGTWAKVRDTVDRDSGKRCGNCNWP